MRRSCICVVKLHKCDANGSDGKWQSARRKARSIAAEGPHSRTLRAVRASLETVRVLDCGSPLPLFRTGATLNDAAQYRTVHLLPIATSFERVRKKSVP